MKKEINSVLSLKQLGAIMKSEQQPCEKASS